MSLLKDSPLSDHGGAPRAATTGAWRRLWITTCIGWCCNLAQPAAGQTPERLLSLEGADRDVIRPLEDALAGESGAWPQAWQRAQEIGPPIAPLVWAELRQDSQPKRRLLWIGAYAAAAGSKAGQRLCDESWTRTARKQELAMAMLALALDGAPVIDAEAVRQVITDSRVDAVRIAGCLALASSGSAVELRDDWLASARAKNAGLCAAAILAGVGRPWSAVQHWLEEGTAFESQLVQRALLLAREPWPDRAARAALAQRALGQDSESASALRAAAAFRIALADDPGEGLEPPSGELLALIARTPAGATAVLRRHWLDPVPSPRLDRLVRRRLSVLFALSAASTDVAAAVPRWRDDPDLAADACLALARRALDASDTTEAAAWFEELAAVAESDWLAAAIAVPARTSAAKSAALASALAGRLPRPALAREIESELWRRGTHPECAAYGCWTDLLRDLLLSGSDHARALDTNQSDRTLVPRDLEPGDPFFEVACEFLDWRVRTRAGPPGQSR
jgi:hypothetical protein